MPLHGAKYLWRPQPAELCGSVCVCKHRRDHALLPEVRGISAAAVIDLVLLN